MVFDALDWCIQSLNERRAQLLALVDDADQATLDWSDGADRWSGMMVLDHLTRVDGSVAALLERLVQRAEVVPWSAAAPAAGSARARRPEVPGRVVEHILSVPTVSDAEPEAGVARDTALARLEEARAAVIGVARSSADRDMSAVIFPHRLLGRMDFYQWLAFLAEHEEGHTNQLRAVLGDARAAATGGAS